MLGELVDPGRQEGDLHLRGTGVGPVPAVLADDVQLGFLGESHATSEVDVSAIPARRRKQTYGRGRGLRHRLAGMLRAAVAAGHPATTAAGVEILEAGGSAADAAVAACLASCVAETVMTGAPRRRARDLPRRGARARARNLDCFCAVPGGTRRRRCSSSTCPSARRSSTTRSARPPAPCRACRRASTRSGASHGRLPWADLCAPALAARPRGRADAARPTSPAWRCSRP